MISYEICYSLHRTLMGLAKRLGSDGGELGALDRLHNFDGTQEDVELAAKIFERAGQHTNAAELRRGCYGPASVGSGLTQRKDPSVQARSDT